MEKLDHITEWFARHRNDDPVNVNLPPKVWSEYFAYLLAIAREHQMERREVTATEVLASVEAEIVQLRQLSANIKALLADGTIKVAARSGEPTTVDAGSAGSGESVDDP